MKLLHRVERDSEGGAFVSVLVSSTEDLWHLYNFIFEGDTIRTTTVRKVVRETNTGNSTAERRVLKLEVVIKNIEFDPIGRMRMRGLNMTETEYVRMGAHPHS